MSDATVLRVLLADDEEAIRHVYSVGLGHYFAPAESAPAAEVAALAEELDGLTEETRPGAEFTLCRQGDEAVRLASEALAAGKPFDVVVLDIRMPPGIDGVETAKRVRELMPDVQIVFVSGFSDYEWADIEKLVPPRNQMDYIQKPVRLSELATKIIAAYERA
ncbi:MAG: response regulator [Woeseiaceae bacterium]|nr:response regulator [Woeseiaceae bacterium]